MKKTRNDKLTALEIALADVPDNRPPEPHEFTIEDYIAACPAPISFSWATQKLNKKVRDGQLKMRKAKFKRANINVYSKP